MPLKMRERAAKSTKFNICFNKSIYGSRKWFLVTHTTNDVGIHDKGYMSELFCLYLIHIGMLFEHITCPVAKHTDT